MKKIREGYKLLHQFYINVKYRSINVPNVTELISSESSDVHWKHLDVAEKNVLDLGCGFWDIEDFSKTSPVYFKQKGAVKIVGIDMREGDVTALKDYFSKHYNGDGSEFLVKMITSADDLKELISTYNITAIKSDIEGFERLFFKLDKDDMKRISSFSVEYHSYDILLPLVYYLNYWGFEIVNHSLFSYAPPSFGVITAVRK